MLNRLGKIRYEEILVPLLAVLLALLVGSVFILIVGENPLTAYKILIRESLGSTRNLATTLQRATPLIFTGLSVAFAFRAGLFNIGAEGQLYVGGFAAAWVGFTFTNLPRVIHLPLAIIAGMLGGALWGAVPGILKAKLGVHEVINTIMMNFIAFFLTDYSLPSAHFMADHGARNGTSSQNGHIYPTISTDSTEYRIYLALAAALLVWFILWKTKLGYEEQAVGLNPSAAGV